jgi:hypothetical protein
LHAQEFVPGPVLAHVAWASQPPLFVRQLLTGEHDCPAPAYPALQVQEFVPGPVLAHAAWASQPPLFVRQLLTAAQLTPLPE